MEQKIMFLFIKTSLFILLPWSSLNKNLVEKCNHCRKINSRNYRLLEKYKQYKDSSVIDFRAEMPNNIVKKKKYIYNNNSNKGTKRKHKHSCKSSISTEEYGKNVKKNKCGKPKTKEYFDFEEKIFKKLDYEDYLKNIKTIEYKEYKKLSCKKRRVRISLLLLVILVLILPILDLSLEKFIDGGLLGLLELLSPVEAKGGGVASGVEGALNTLLSKSSWGMLEKISASTIFFYCVPFLIFVVIFIFGMIYYYRKVLKYENIKFRKRSNKK
ncbi:fam-l protein [Plasmodium brasilianum]|uniref:fam-l protein n=1 Tax=Plasmodium brasilianum TaxID=5824 RepID=UPI00350E52B9|nr:fam-l protein [Plasmodium brasilianum]